MSIPPPGYVNTTTPAFATVKCGNVTQTVTYTTDATEPVDIGFTDAATWSDTQSFTSDNTITWDCQTSGIYNLKFNQTVDVTNVSTPADSAIAVIPNTAFFLDISGNLEAPQVGNALIHPITTAQSSISYTTSIVESDILMGSFTTPVGFLTSPVFTGGQWNISLFANTTDGDELNGAYMSVYAVDADGSSNEVLIFDGTGEPFIVNGEDITNYNHIYNIPTYVLDNMTQRIQVRLYGNFGTLILPPTGNVMTFYFRDSLLSAVQTTISQDVVPLTADTVDLRMIVTSATTEFNQVFATSIPISIGTALSKTYSASVNAIANVSRGDSIVCSIVAVDGNVVVSSGATTLPSPANTLQWNLIAEGVYGNPDIIVEPSPMIEGDWRRPI